MSYLAEARAARLDAEAHSNADAGRDLIDLLAVVLGVCESLSGALKADPRLAELADVGVLAAGRAAGLVADLRAANDAAPATDRQPAAPSGARTVLVVEDEPELRNLISAAFTRAGFAVFGAANGREGVKLLMELQPDLMITDIVMPEMEGIGAILEARRHAPLTRVIAISGGGNYGKSASFLEWASELGADEVLAKPFRVSSLVTAARVVLERPSEPLRAAQ